MTVTNQSWEEGAQEELIGRESGQKVVIIRQSSTPPEEKKRLSPLELGVRAEI